MGVLTKSDIVKVKEIDRNVKNKFSFPWLERTVEIASGLKVSLGDDIAKTDDAGQAVGKLCNKHISYGSRGAIALDEHVKSAKHLIIIQNLCSERLFLFKEMMFPATQFCYFRFRPGEKKPPWPPYKGAALAPQDGLGGPLDPRPIFLFFHNFPFSSLN